jgi:hypothetical protein
MKSKKYKFAMGEVLVVLRNPDMTLDTLQAFKKQFGKGLRKLFGSTIPIMSGDDILSQDAEKLLMKGLASNKETK